DEGDSRGDQDDGDDSGGDEGDSEGDGDGSESDEGDTEDDKNGFLSFSQRGIIECFCAVSKRPSRRQYKIFAISS
ncbi:unnamed protein product, partial [Didymodactylos carnosus]